VIKFGETLKGKGRKLTKVKTHPVIATLDIPLFNFVGKRELKVEN
jgi:hypothetical protein